MVVKPAGANGSAMLAWRLAFQVHPSVDVPLRTSRTFWLTGSWNATVRVLLLEFGMELVSWSMVNGGLVAKNSKVPQTSDRFRRCFVLRFIYGGSTWQFEAADC